MHDDGNFVLFGEPQKIFQVAFDLRRRCGEIAKDARHANADRTRGDIGVAGIFSYFAAPPAQVEGDLKKFLRLAEQYEIPIVVQLDGKAWWDARPDLWNWWDASRPGFNPSNRFNVEWSGWQPTDAMRIAWRNWGSITRVLPPPNLMSPAYRAAWRKEMQRLVPVVVAWQKNLPADKRWLLIGVKVGWESSIGVNAWYYPDGNKLADLPHSSDPTNNVQAKFTPARGVAQIGYASVKTAGLRREGEITEADLAEIVRRHLEDMCRTPSSAAVRHISSKCRRTISVRSASVISPSRRRPAVLTDA